MAEEIKDQDIESEEDLGPSELKENTKGQFTRDRRKAFNWDSDKEEANGVDILEEGEGEPLLKE